MQALASDPELTQPPSDSVILVDIRRRANYDRWHIAGSKHIPFRCEEGDGKESKQAGCVSPLDRRLFELCPRHIPFLVLCDFGDLSLAAFFFATRPAPWTVAGIVCLEGPDRPLDQYPVEHALSYKNITPVCYLQPHVYDLVIRQCTSAEAKIVETVGLDAIRQRPHDVRYWDHLLQILDTSERLEEGKSYCVRDKSGVIRARATIENLCEFATTFGALGGSESGDTEVPTSSSDREEGKFYKRQKCASAQSTTEPSPELGFFAALDKLTPNEKETVRRCFHMIPGAGDLLDLERLFASDSQASTVLREQLVAKLLSTGWIGWASQASLSGYDSTMDLGSAPTAIRPWEELERTFKSCIQQSEEEGYIRTCQLGTLEESPVVFYHPSPLLEEYVSVIEASLCERNSQTPHTVDEMKSPRYHASLDLPEAKTMLGSELPFTSLDLGCGQGRDSLWLAARKQGEQSLWRAFCVDEIPQMLTNLQLAAKDNEVLSFVAPFRSRIRADGVIASRPVEPSYETELSLYLTQQHVLRRQPPTEESTNATQLPSQSTEKNLAQHRPIMTEAGSKIPAATDPGCYPWYDRQFDLVMLVRFHSEGLLPFLPQLVAPGGYILYSHFAEGCSHPSNVIKKGQLEEVFSEAAGFTTVANYINEFPDGRPFANFIAERTI